MTSTTDPNRPAERLKPPNTFEDALFSLDLAQLPTDFPQRVYNALCNRGWRRIEPSGYPAAARAYTCSWRYAGGLAADLAHGARGEGNYMEYYCSGNEGAVDEAVETALNCKGWKSCSHDEACAWIDPEHAAGYIASHQFELWLKEQRSEQIFSRRYTQSGMIEYSASKGEPETFYIDRSTGIAYQQHGDIRQVVLEAPEVSHFQTGIGL